MKPPTQRSQQFTDPAYFTDAELESAKTILETNDLFEREKTERIRAHARLLVVVDRDRIFPRLSRKTACREPESDINRYIKTYIQGKNHIAIAMVSPEGRKQAALTEQDLIGGAK